MQNRDARRDVYRLCVERGWDLLALSGRKNTLESIFLRLTSGEFDNDGGNPASVQQAHKETPAEHPKAVAEAVGYTAPLPTFEEAQKDLAEPAKTDSTAETADSPKGGD